MIPNIALETFAIPPVANAQHDPSHSSDSDTSPLRETIRPRQLDPSAATAQAAAETTTTTTTTTSWR